MVSDTLLREIDLLSTEDCLDLRAYVDSKLRIQGEGHYQRADKISLSDLRGSLRYDGARVSLAQMDAAIAAGAAGSSCAV